MADSLDERLLIEQFKGGDQAAFDKLIERHCAEVAAMANRLLGWPGEVEDVVQDVFLAAYVGLRRFRCECSLRTWLFTITVNKCRRYRYKRLIRLDRLWKGRDCLAVEADRSAVNAEAFDRLRKAISRLPAKYREAIVLRYLQELSTDEITQMLAITASALQVRLNRARQLLKEKLGDVLQDELMED